MSGMYSDFLANKINDHINGVASYTAPTEINLALFTARGSIAQACAGTTFTEVTGGSYARVNAGVGTVNWNGSAARLCDNKLSVPFVTATADWGIVTCYGAYDQAANLLWWADLTTPKSVPDGATASFATGTIDVSLPQGA